MLHVLDQTDRARSLTSNFGVEVLTQDLEIEAGQYFRPISARVGPAMRNTKADNILAQNDEKL
jgi:hypothetical protein